MARKDNIFKKYCPEAARKNSSPCWTPHLLGWEVSLLIGLDTTLPRMGLLVGLDTKFTRIGIVLAIRARYYMY